MLLSLLVGGCAVRAIGGGPCAIDLPPGDVGSIAVVNDTAQDVTVFDCDSSSCVKGINGETLAAHTSKSRNYVMCSGFSVGVTDPKTGILLGCLVEPIGEPPKVSSLIVSQQTSCPEKPPAMIRPRIYDPTR